jgi:hypothetical protein
MSDKFKSEIERLLDEPAEPQNPGAPADRLRARLAATLSEGLGDAQVSASDAANPASMAAFLDGRLTGEARDKFARVLADEPGLRADMESAADLVSSVTESPLSVPKHLMARAAVQFAPEPPRVVETRSRWSFSFADLLPRQRVALAAVAVLAVMLAIPAGMMFKGGGGGEPELSGVSEADLLAAKVKACKDKQAKEADQAKASKTAPPAAPKTADGKPKDPCDPAELKKESAKKK